MLKEFISKNFEYLTKTTLLELRKILLDFKISRYIDTRYTRILIKKIYVYVFCTNFFIVL